MKTPGGTTRTIAVPDGQTNLQPFSRHMFFLPVVRGGNLASPAPPFAILVAATPTKERMAMASRKSAAGDQYEAVGAAMIAYEIAIVSILETLAKTQPATARAISKSLAVLRKAIPPTQSPKIGQKVGVYISVIDTTLAKNPQ